MDGDGRLGSWGGEWRLFLDVLFRYSDYASEFYETNKMVVLV